MIATPDRTPLPRNFVDRPVLVRSTPEGPIVLRLTEAETYDGPDAPGSHAHRGRTARRPA